MSNAFSVVISTRKRDDDYIKHVTERFNHPDTEILVYENNGEYSLPQLYNKGLDESKNDLVVYMHDDLFIETQDVTKKLNRLFRNNPEYGIIGLAGTTQLLNGMWWQNRQTMYGQVKHQQGDKTWLSAYSDTFGDNLKEVVMVDGLFFAVDKNRIKERFDEEFEGFHFYDVPFCVLNFRQGVKIGVTTKIMVIHKSIGATDKKWEKNKLFFEAKYQKFLPLFVI
jgi:hypothetical protein